METFDVSIMAKVQLLMRELMLRLINQDNIPAPNVE